MSKAGSRVLQGAHEAHAYAKNAGLPHFEIRSLSEEEGGGYLIEFPDYPGCIADGATPAEAMRESADALESYRRTLQELGRATPASGGIGGTLQEEGD